MALSGPQQEQLVKAFLNAFPRYTDLKYIVKIKISEDLDAIAPGGSLRDCVFEVINWVESRRRLKELLYGALQENPTNPLLQRCGIDFDVIAIPQTLETQPSASLGEIAPVLPQVSLHNNVRFMPPLIPQQLRASLTDVLLRVPGIQTFEGRSSLLRGLPSIHTLDRNSINARRDLLSVIEQLCHIGQTTAGKWPLVVLLDNAIEDTRGYILEEEMRQLQQDLLLCYKGA